MFYMLVLTSNFRVKCCGVTVQMKAIEWYFPLVLFIMLYTNRGVKSMHQYDKIFKWYRSLHGGQQPNTSSGLRPHSETTFSIIMVCVTPIRTQLPHVLFQLMNNPLLGIKRHEVEGQHVILYFDEIDKVSFSFKIYQSTIVKKTKPASVTAYDYYETRKYNNTLIISNGE